MIPYEELEKALARWRNRSSHKEGATPEPTGEVEEVGTAPHRVNGLPAPTELTGEIDMNDDVLESVDVGRRRRH
jgi:hypothetical protein